MACPICDNKPANCDCTELERRQHEEIEWLTAELERHRMTEEERWASKYASAYFRRGGYPDTAAADAIRGYISRTAPKEVGRE